MLRTGGGISHHCRIVSTAFPSPAVRLLSIYSSYCLFASPHQGRRQLTARSPSVTWWKRLEHKGKGEKMDLLKTSYNLICQCNKWEQSKRNTPIPTPPCFIFHSLLLRGLWGLLLHATVGDQGRETAYILSSHLTKGFHTLMRLLGKLPPSLLRRIYTSMMMWCLN